MTSFNRKRQILPRVWLAVLVMGMVTGGGPIDSGPRQVPVALAQNRPDIPEPAPLGDSARNFVSVAKTASPTVVNISATRTVTDPDQHDPHRFFDDPSFGPVDPPSAHQEESLGSGVIIGNGYIVTNYHVIARAERITVLVGERSEFQGALVGADPPSDLAVIRIAAVNLPAISWGDSTRLQVGDYVLAIGNPLGLNQTVTMGIVSAVGRANVGIAAYEDFIQTDAPVNPGNSGGALVNVRGELVGINTAIFSQSGGFMGIGFAVPSQMAKAVTDSLISRGRVVRGWLGVTVQDLTAELAEHFDLQEARGALVSGVQPGSPAEHAGLRRGDVIVAVDDQLVEGASQLRNMVAQLEVDSTVPFTVIRRSRETPIPVTIREQPRPRERSRAPAAEAP